MYASERRRLIGDDVAEHGRVTVTELAERLDVSTETIRRDLAWLETAGRVERTHGGAVPLTPSGRSERALATRTAENTAAKQAIADLALGLLPPAGGSLLVDAGSTTARVAADLPHGHGLLVVTGSAPIAAQLAAAGTGDVHLLGGQVRGLTGACVGHLALAALERVRCDVVFLGTNGLAAERGLTTPDPEEAAVKRAMRAAGRRVVALCDSSKFGHDHLVSFAALSDVDVLVTDRRPGAELAAALENSGIEVLHP